MYSTAGDPGEKKGWTQGRADFMIALIAMAWGSSYLMIKIGLGEIPPLLLIGLRFTIAFAAVTAVFFKRVRKSEKRTIFYGAILGILLFILFGSLNYGMQTTSVSNAGFLFSTTVVLVPVFNGIFLRRMPERAVICGVAVTFAGICLLSLQSSFSLQRGDLLCIASAVLYALHIIITDRFAKKADGLLLGIWQLCFAGAFGFIGSFFLESATFPHSAASWMAVLGMALISSAFGFVMQPVAQKYTTPEHTSLLFSLEPVFAAVFAFLFFGETLSAKGYAGAVLVLTGVLLTSVFSKITKKAGI